MPGKSTLYLLSHSEAPKNNKLAVTDIREKPEDFFTGTARVPTLASAISNRFLCQSFRSCRIYNFLQKAKTFKLKIALHKLHRLCK